MRALGIAAIGLVCGYLWISFVLVDGEKWSLELNAESSVRQRLIDPGSAQFEKPIVIKSEGLVCGFVNAKNRMGGYVGRQLYVYWEGEATLITDDYALKSYHRQIYKCGISTS